MGKSCPFCNRSQFEERLVGSIGPFRVIATLGQISDGGYLLLVPKEHISCLGVMPDAKELEWAIARLRAELLEEYAPSGVTLFEHGIIGQTVFHAHLHVIPEIVAVGEQVRRDFPDHPVEEFADFRAFRFAHVIEQRPYILWKESSGRLSVCWNPPAMAQYLRIVVAGALGKPERANWRTMNATLDRKLYLATVARLKSHFPQDS